MTNETLHNDMMIATLVREARELSEKGRVLVINKIDEMIQEQDISEETYKAGLVAKEMILAL